MKSGFFFLIHIKREWGFLSLKTRKKADFWDRRRLTLQRVLGGDWDKAPNVVVLRWSALPPLTPYLPSHPHSLWMRYDLTRIWIYTKQLVTVSPVGFPPSSQFWSSNKRLKNLILGRGRVWRENESGPTRFSSWNYSFYPVAPFSFSLLTVIPLPRSPPLSILSA